MLALLILAQAAEPSVAMPAFLAGCWEQRKEADWTQECWTDARGGVMIGSGRDATGDTIKHWEWMRIERGADGVVTFYGSPKGAPAVGFKLVQSGPGTATFVNAGHDYPQRVHYSMTTVGLDAEVSLADGSKPMRWSYRRTAGSTAK